MYEARPDSLVPAQRQPEQAWPPGSAPPAAAPTRLLQGVDVLSSFTGCSPAVVAEVVLGWAARHGLAVEDFAERLLAAVEGDEPEDERLVVGVVEAVLSLDGAAHPPGRPVAPAGLSRRQRTARTAWLTSLSTRVDSRPGLLRAREAFERHTAMLDVGPGQTSPFAGRRAVLAHRQVWFTRQLRDELAAHGIEVVAVVEDGAAAVGAAVSLQPHVLVLEDGLPILSGPEVATEVGVFAPETLTVAQVEDASRVAALRTAGVEYVISCQVQPADVATGVASELRRSWSSYSE